MGARPSVTARNESLAKLTSSGDRIAGVGEVPKAARRLGHDRDQAFVEGEYLWLAGRVLNDAERLGVAPVGDRRIPG